MAGVLLSAKFTLKTNKNTGQKGIKLQHKFTTFPPEKQGFSTGYYLIKTRFKKATYLWVSMERETMVSGVPGCAPGIISYVIARSEATWQSALYNAAVLPAVHPKLSGFWDTDCHGLRPRNDMLRRFLHRKSAQVSGWGGAVLQRTEKIPAFAGGDADCQRSRAEFAATAANKMKIIFCRGVYLAENTSQAASVEFVCRRQTNYARSRLQKTVGKGQRPFPTSSIPALAGGDAGYGITGCP